MLDISSISNRMALKISIAYIYRVSQKNWVLPNWAVSDLPQISLVFLPNWQQDLQMLNLAKLSFFETPCRNPFDRPTNQTSSSTTFSVKGSCSDNADFAFAEFEFESTLVTEWNWVIFKFEMTVKIIVTAQYCRTPQTSYVQLFYIFGLFVGSFLLGRVADRCS